VAGETCRSVTVTQCVDELYTCGNASSLDAEDIDVGPTAAAAAAALATITRAASAHTCQTHVPEMIV